MFALSLLVPLDPQPYIIAGLRVVKQFARVSDTAELVAEEDTLAHKVLVIGVRGYILSGR